MQNPNDVKSQDDTRATQDKRSVEVLVHAIEKCERLQKQLDIAVEALRLYSNLRGDGTVTNYESVAKSALKQIKEIE